MRNALILMAAGLASGTVFAQSAIDAYQISQPDLKGTARFMSMGGAFGALGGDLSSLSQNPAGIGVYRTNDIGITFDFDAQRARSQSGGVTTDDTKTRFLVNNIGAVFTMKLPSSVVPNVNIGFTYNKAVSFNRQYVGHIPNLPNSLSNYIAGVSNSNELTVGDVESTNSFDPYYPNDGGYAAPWISILGYDSYLTTPVGSGTDTKWYGQWGDGTSGTGNFGVKETGAVDEYNIALGGNINNILYVGMNFDITSLNYTMSSTWGEDLRNAYIPNAQDTQTIQGDASWRLGNYYNVSGTGFNYQLGVIFKPIPEFRLGLAFHTPTYYSLTEKYAAGIDYNYPTLGSGGASTSNGEMAYNDIDFRTPMKLIASAAGVIGGRFILSADYEWTPYNKMKYSAAGSYGIGDPWDDDPWDYGPWFAPKGETRGYGYAPVDEFADTNDDIKYYYRATNTLRVGAEFRVTPAFSVRAGYSFVSSPVKDSARDDREIVYTSGTMPHYRFDDTTNYITCGFGYRYQHFYVDLAYVNKQMNSTYHAFTPDIDRESKYYSASPQSKLKFTNNQVVLTAGFKF